MDLAIAYDGKSAELKTPWPKTTTVKVGSTVPVCGAHFGRRRKNDEDCMYRSTFGRMERHNFAATVKKSNEVTVEFRRFTDNCKKKINAKVSSHCILLTVFCKGTKIYSIQRFRTKKRNFSPQKCLLKQKTHKVKLHLLVILFIFYFYLFSFASQRVKPGRAIWEPSTWHQVEARIQKYLSAT